MNTFWRRMLLHFFYMCGDQLADSSIREFILLNVHDNHSFTIIVREELNVDLLLCQINEQTTGIHQPVVCSFYNYEERTACNSSAVLLSS